MNWCMLGVFAAAMLAGCLQSDAGAPGSGHLGSSSFVSIHDLTLTGCDSANIHVYHPLDELRALVPEPFVVVPYQTDLTGVLVVNVVDCAETSAIEVTVLIEPPGDALPEIVTAYDADGRVPHDEAGLPLDQYLIGAFTTRPSLVTAYQTAGVFAGQMEAIVEVIEAPGEAGAAVSVRAVDSDLALVYQSAAPTSRYGDVTHRFWHLNEDTLAVFEHFLPDPAYAFPGAMTCVVRPGSALAEMMMRPVCHPVMASAVFGFEWWGNAYIFDRAEVGL